MGPRMCAISIVIPCFNGNATLGQQLEALARQQDAPEFEVVVVDNLSTTPPDSVVAAWQSELPGLRIVRATEGQGISVARNVGVREAASDRIALCDADDVAGPNFVRAAHDGLDVADFVTGNVVTVDAQDFTSVDAVWAFLPSTATIEPARLGLVDRDYPIMMGGACALRRQAVLALDGYDQAFFPGVEDNDFALRALAAGYEIATSSGMTLAERRRATSGGSFRRSYDAGRMHMKLCERHDLWGSSPHLHEPTWWVDLLKLPLSGARMLASSPRDYLGFAGRAGLRLGQAVGFFHYRVRHEPVVPALGVGLSHASKATTQ